MPNCLCDKCAALCCRYFALPIDAPTSAREYDDIRWYLVHENVFVFIEKRKWYLGIYSRCKHLQADNRCGIYLTRPQICRDLARGSGQCRAEHDAKSSRPQLALLRARSRT